MKKLLTIIAAMVLVIGLIAGCGSSSSNGGDGDKKQGTIGFSVSTLNNPFFVSLKMVLKNKLKN